MSEFVDTAQDAADFLRKLVAQDRAVAGSQRPDDLAINSLLRAHYLEKAAGYIEDRIRRDSEIRQWLKEQEEKKG